MTRKIIIAIAFLLSALGQAEAGAIANGAWTAPGCGAEPPAPTLDLSTRSKYNQSVTAAAAYQQQAKDYDACLLKEANGDVALINDTFKSEHQRVHDSFEKLRTDSEAASAKFNTK